MHGSHGYFDTLTSRLPLRLVPRGEVDPSDDLAERRADAAGGRRNLLITATVLGALAVLSAITGSTASAVFLTIATAIVLSIAVVLHVVIRATDRMLG